MYKLLLSWRYLRTRYIALASIVSVTLGVATLIVVNSVMSGFTHEMRKRLHGILSDVELASPGLGELHDPQRHMQEIRQILGDDLAGISAVVRVPAMIHIHYRGRMMVNHQIMLMGIDDETYSQVSDFGPYLLNELNRRSPSFDLREEGYDSKLPKCGWPYRREQAAYERAIAERHRGHSLPDRGRPASAAQDGPNGGVQFRRLPTVPPAIPEGTISQQDQPVQPLQQNHPSPDSAQPPLPAFDPYQQEIVNLFDPAKEQHTGIILGVALASRRVRNSESNEIEDIFLCRPGDNVQITLPTVGTPPRPVSELCTVVDFYESGMHEYDSTFAFMPLSQLQRIRKMIGFDGQPTVSAIQIKLTDKADLEDVRNRLQAHFVSEMSPYQVQTWKDTQRPLLAAVQLEITILNILLFLIIAVAGFGILATFFMIVVEKTKDIGILKALGAPSRGVMSIFLGYGLSLGIVGSGVGIVIGLVLVAYINNIADLVEWMTGQEVFDQTVYYFSEIPTIVDPWTVTLVAIGAVMIAVVASVLPAVRAARLHPVEALRYE